MIYLVVIDGFAQKYINLPNDFNHLKDDRHDMPESIRKLVRELSPVPFGSNKEVNIELYELVVKNDVIQRGSYCTSFTCQIPQKPMNYEQFLAEANKLTADLRPGFRNFVFNFSNHRTDDYEKCLEYMKELIDGIELGLKDYYDL